MGRFAKVATIVAWSLGFAPACASFSGEEVPDGGSGEGGRSDAGSGDAGDAAMAGDAGGLVPQAALCGAARALGAVGTYSGKVNVHSPATSADTNDNLLRQVNTWIPDPDCQSGQDVNPLAYCQKLWPQSRSARAGSPSAEQKPFYTSGCSTVYKEPGQAIYVCCDQ